MSENESKAKEPEGKVEAEELAARLRASYDLAHGKKTSLNPGREKPPYRSLLYKRGKSNQVESRTVSSPEEEAQAISEGWKDTPHRKG